LKKVKKILIFAFAAVFIILSTVIVLRMNKQMVCKAVQLNIRDTNQNSIVHSNEIMKFIAKEKASLIGQSMDKIDLVALERRLDNFPAIKDAQVYKTVGGTIIFEIKQRIPIMRVINASGENFYVDQEGYAMPLTDNFTSRVVVVNGAIKAKYNKKDTASLEFIGDNASQGKKQLKEVYTLAKYIYKNPFWKAQIEQMYVNESGDIELIPKVGAHIIVFGDSQDYEWKFIKLEAMYREGLRVAGWNKYKTINLKFSNQVVCTKI
jgi:cell division protein FtsQ